MYKLRLFVRERVQKLQAAGIKPTLKRVVFLERTLANHSKHMLLPRVEQGGAASVSMDEARPASDEAVVRMLRDLQTQMQQQQLLHQQQFTQLEQQLKQQQQQQQQQQQLTQQQQQQQQQQHLLRQLQQQQEQHQQEMSRLQQQIQQLAQQPQHLQQ